MALHYSIHFEARATRWDYYIITKSKINVEGLSIETHQDFTFEGPTHVTTQNLS